MPELHISQAYDTESLDSTSIYGNRVEPVLYGSRMPCIHFVAEMPFPPAAKRTWKADPVDKEEVISYRQGAER
jgi:hypothetical protein